MQPGSQDLGRADLHVHTDLSDGMASIPQLLEHVEHRTNLDLIAITDHDDLMGSLKARELAVQKGCRFGVIPGMEVTTLDGHLLALFLERPVRSFQSVDRTVDEIHAQGGLCVIPHPMSWLTRSMGQKVIERLMAQRPGQQPFDGIELVNQTLAGRQTYHKVRELNRRWYHLAEVGGSDAHFVTTVGCSYTLFPGRGAEELRRAILDKRTQAAGEALAELGRIGYRRLLAQQFKSLVVWPSRLLGRSMMALFRGGPR